MYYFVACEIYINALIRILSYNSNLMKNEILFLGDEDKVLRADNNGQISSQVTSNIQIQTDAGEDFFSCW